MYDEPTKSEKCISGAPISKEGKDQVTVDAINVKYKHSHHSMIAIVINLYNMDEAGTTYGAILFNLDQP